ncbi:hypothetical protein [Butyrivibrio sp. AC2005]|uniref:hypothetical protein n=1 Tax=Butyrivibrio sp. AC2005 TaxID=1280672 RepID=UPI0004167DEA|nr:hypothetical protein [Butyrivibrio sp. AC2005]
MIKYNEVMENIKVTDEMRRRILTNIEKEIGAELEKQGVHNTSEVIDKSNNSYTRKNTSGNKIIQIISRYGSMVAIFVLVIAGTYAFVKNIGLNETAPGMDNTSSYEQSTSEMPIEINPIDKTIMNSDNTGDISNDIKENDALTDAQIFDSVSELSGELGFEITDIDILAKDAESIDYYKSNDAGIIKYTTANDVITYSISPTNDYAKGREEIVAEESFETEKVINTDVKLYGKENVYKLVSWQNDGLWYVLESQNGIRKEEIIHLVEVQLNEKE